jgi:hypothetical protein
LGSRDPAAHSVPEPVVISPEKPSAEFAPLLAAGWTVQLVPSKCSTSAT